MPDPIALVRGVPASFTDCVTAVPPDPPLDVGTARLQHDGYVAALESGGFSVESVPVADDHPDSSFVEDAAVVIGERGLVTRPGHESRRGEVGPVAVALARHLQLDRIGEPAVIDGGDVLRIGDRIFVGLSGRTNRAGVDAVAAVAESQGFTVVAVPVRETLHLKSGVSAIGDDAILWHPAACESGVFGSLAVIEVPGDDPEAANVVRLGDGRILVADHHFTTIDLLADRGIDVVATDVSEFARAEGGLTCLSIRLRWE